MLSNPNDQIQFNLDAIREIYLAGGCFWGVDAYMSRITGVCKTQCGYANGNTRNPSYEQVCHENTGHAETVKINYDASIITLANLLEEFFEIIDPTSLNRQGGDTGRQYRSGIYYTNTDDLEIIRETALSQQPKYEKTIVTEILPLANYYPAEEYHQNYLDKNPNGYCHIHLNRFVDNK